MRSIGNLPYNRMLSEVSNDWGHWSGVPMGVLAQFFFRMSSLISPKPGINVLCLVANDMPKKLLFQRHFQRIKVEQFPSLAKTGRACTCTRLMRMVDF